MGPHHARREREMLTRLQKVMKMDEAMGRAEGPPSIRQVAHAWSSSLRS